MHIPTKVKITLAIIIAIGIGTGALVLGLLLHDVSNAQQERSATFIAIGATILASSVAALIAHLAGGFRDIRDDR